MKTGNAARFGGFAAAHVLWSLVCAAPVMRLLGTGPDARALAAVGMLGYLLLGWAVARFCHWSAPTWTQGLFAVLLPAGIAWLWAGSTALCLYGSGGSVIVAAALGLPAFFLAAPSVLFLYEVMGAAGELLGGGAPRPWLAAAIFLPACCRPCFSFLENCWESKKRERCEPLPFLAAVSVVCQDDLSILHPLHGGQGLHP